MQRYPRPEERADASVCNRLSIAAADLFVLQPHFRAEAGLAELTENALTFSTQSVLKDECAVLECAFHRKEQPWISQLVSNTHD